MPQAVGPTTLGEIQISAIIAIPQPRTLPTHKNLLWPLDAGHQAFAGQVVTVRWLHGVHDQIIQTGRAAPQIKQIHLKKPRFRFFVFPMQTPSMQTVFIVLSGPVSLVNAVRLGAGTALSHFDFTAFSISITYGFQATALFRRGLRRRPCGPGCRATVHLTTGAVAADPPPRTEPRCEPVRAQQQTLAADPGGTHVVQPRAAVARWAATGAGSAGQFQGSGAAHLGDWRVADRPHQPGAADARTGAQGAAASGGADLLTDRT